MYLVDTNIWLERLLDQENAAVAGTFLDKTPSDQLYLTDFAFHSLGVILTRLGENEAYRLFIHDLFEQGSVRLLSLEPSEIKHLIDAINRFKLDFDDAYQYTVARINKLTVVTFDSDFNKTDIKVLRPE